MKYPDKKIMIVSLQYDYGQRSRGIASEKIWFHDTFQRLVGRVEAFWYDDFIKDARPLQSQLLEAADKLKPDLIFFLPYTDQFDIETLEQLKKKYVTVCWFGDDQWRFPYYTKRLAPHFSRVITTDPMRIPDYRDLGLEPILSDWAGERRDAVIGGLDTVDHQYDVSFIGGRNDVRSWFIRRLEQRGINVHCFGAGWPAGRLDFEQMKAVFLRSRINLNLSNSVPKDVSFIFSRPRNFARWLISKKQTEQVKARNFEIPLAGGFQLSQYAVGLERHWEIGREIAIYNTPDECASQIYYYLSNAKERDRMTAAAHERAVREHTFDVRLSNILSEIF